MPDETVRILRDIFPAKTDMTGKQISGNNGFLARKPGRTPKTEETYKSRSAHILTKIEADMPPDTPIGPSEIYEWLQKSAQNFLPSTTRLYKAVMTFELQQKMSQGLFDEQETLLAIEKIKDIKGSDQHVKMTSATKSKSASEKVIASLLTKLQTKDAGYSMKCAALMFQASLITGLRPSEWFSAKISQMEDSDDFLLTVKSAKTTNNRGTGEYRKLIVPESQSKVVRETIDFVTDLLQLGMSPKTILASAQQAITRTNTKTAHGAHVTLYSARHQFAANMKNIFPLDEVSALMGHASPKTTSGYYGKRKSGHKRFKDARSLGDNNMPSDGSDTDQQKDKA